MTTNNFYIKLRWIFLILLIFALGFWNIALAFADYYDYDVITNIVRVKPSSVTFPAITICNIFSYRKDLYVNGIFFNSTNLNVSNDINPNIRNFIDWKYTRFIFSRKSSFLNDYFLQVREYLEYFRIPDNFECLRFNGVTNKSVKLFTAKHTEDYFRIRFYDSYNQTIGSNRIEYTSTNRPRVFISDNYLNSFSEIEPYLLVRNKRYDFDIAKETVEIKLPEPYNQCKESLSVKSYHQSNCLDTCLYREIRKKYNCSFLFTLYSFDGFRKCDNLVDYYKEEFSKVCLKECPLESCYSEKYHSLIKIYEIKDLNNNNNTDYTEFRFSFYDFSTLNITQIPKTDLFTFINNVGGGLGLFMGIAFPNIIEFLQFITDIFLTAFTY